MNPTVSIVIPVYNRAHLIGETLDSIMAQSHTDWECIVVDDGSTDNTIEVIVNYQKKDHRIQAHRRPENRPKGANACRNYGWELAKGTYIKFFDSDDIMCPEFIQKQLECLDSNESLDFCAAYWEIWYADGSRMKNKPYTDIDYHENPVRSYLLESHIFPTPSPLWRRSFLNTVERFNENLHRGQEADFHFNIMLRSPKYKFVEDFLFWVRVGHPSIKTNASSFLSHSSVFMYFTNVKHKLLASNNPDKERLLQYTFFRMGIAFYNMIVTTDKTNKQDIFKTNYPELKALSEFAFINK
ncbi:MAG: glycosyltransferase family 2 protein, partial [Bacteroidota bacterium]